ncbi:MAG TPA: ATP-dependent sacrificial sulfur transferase LarE [Terriglobales bacterium]|nr:ATP-dependent sacrificial sulfur transferase LarE [Terriglobales bacterium]
MKSTQLKLESLKNSLKKMKRVLIAFSGGVDSSFLLKVALDALGRENVLAVTADSETYPRTELKEASAIAKGLGLDGRHRIIHTSEFKIKEFLENPTDRCYYCKYELFSRLKKIAHQNKIDYVLDGSNYSDRDDFRPGRKAINKLKVRSPLLDAELTKDEIRTISKKLKLPTWNKPAYACLSSRIPYGENITLEKLSRIEKAEKFLWSLGFSQLRVRHHDKIARIELDPREFSRFADEKLRQKVYQKLKDLGFTYVTLDLLGYRTGSMNEVLNRK